MNNIKKGLLENFYSFLNDKIILNGLLTYYSSLDKNDSVGKLNFNEEIMTAFRKYSINSIGELELAAECNLIYLISDIEQNTLSQIKEAILYCVSEGYKKEIIKQLNIEKISKENIPSNIYSILSKLEMFEYRDLISYLGIARKITIDNDEDRIIIFSLWMQYVSRKLKDEDDWFAEIWSFDILSGSIIVSELLDVFFDDETDDIRFSLKSKPVGKLSDDDKKILNDIKLEDSKDYKFYEKNFSKRINNYLVKYNLHYLDSLKKAIKYDLLFLVDGLSKKDIKEIEAVVKSLPIDSKKYEYILKDDYKIEYKNYVDKLSDLLKENDVIFYSEAKDKLKKSLKISNLNFEQKIGLYLDLFNYYDRNGSFYSYQVSETASKGIDNFLSYFDKFIDKISHFITKEDKQRIKIKYIYYFYERIANNEKYNLNYFLTSSKFAVDVSEIILLNAFKQKPFYSYTYDELSSLIKFTNNETIIIKALINLINSGMVYEKNNKFKIKLPSFIKYVDNFPDDVTRDMLMMKLNGSTLEEIGKKNNLTRERIRQKIIPAIARIKKCAFSIDNPQYFKEEEYADLFMTYDIKNASDFEMITGESNIVYNYLNLTYTKGNKKIKDALSDIKLSKEMRNNIASLLKDEYVVIDGKIHRLIKHELINFYLSNYCFEEFTIEEFANNYNAFLGDNGVENGKMFITVDEYRTYSNRFDSSRKILQSGKSDKSESKNFKYYDVDMNDYSDLFDELDLCQYDDIMISARKLFIEHPQIMEQYDISNEFELHSLLKKICNKDDFPNIDFSRTPHIKFGNFDNTEYVVNILKELSRVTPEDLAKRIEEETGIQAATLRANHFKCIDKYFGKGVYEYPTTKLSNDEVEKLKSSVVYDCYTMQEFYYIFEKTIPGKRDMYITNYLFNQLGYNVYSGYILSKKWDTVSYFKNELLKNAEYDISSMYNRFGKFSSFTNIYLDFIKDRTLVRYKPNYIVTEKAFHKYGISKEYMEYICNQCFNRIGNDIFDVYYLKKKFPNLLDAIHPNCFYEEVFKTDDRFSWSKIDNKIIFAKKELEVDFPKLIEMIVAEKEQIKFIELVQYLHDKFDINLDKTKLISYIEKSKVIYDDVQNMIYKF